MSNAVDSASPSFTFDIANFEKKGRVILKANSVVAGVPAADITTDAAFTTFVLGLTAAQWDGLARRMVIALVTVAPPEG